MSRGAQILEDMLTSSLSWTGRIYDLIDQIIEHHPVPKMLEQVGGASTILTCEIPHVPDYNDSQHAADHVLGSVYVCRDNSEA